MISNHMKKTIAIVLVVHAAILVMIWGGLSTLGAAALLMVPFLGTCTWFAYQKGRDYKPNRRRSKAEERPLTPAACMFRG